MKDLKDWMMVALMATILVMSVTTYGMVWVIANRKSKPPVKIVDPNEIKYRKDICNEANDQHTSTGETLRYNA